MKIKYILLLLAVPFVALCADDRIYQCEFGVEGGYSYFLNKEHKYPFQSTNASWMAGANFRYHFDQRWSLLVHGHYLPKNQIKPNRMYHVDVCADFNFFRFGNRSYDIRVKPITPYIFCGIGANIGTFIGNPNVAIKTKIVNSIYIPFGVGMKWKFAPQWNLVLTWQDDIFVDQLVRKDPLNLNQTGAITLGVTVEFAKEKRVCRKCRE